jgi:hypothetical protein
VYQTIVLWRVFDFKGCNPHYDYLQLQRRVVAQKYSHGTNRSRTSNLTAMLVEIKSTVLLNQLARIVKNRRALEQLCHKFSMTQREILFNQPAQMGNIRPLVWKL